jgi:hypothetical protein
MCKMCIVYMYTVHIRCKIQYTLDVCNLVDIGDTDALKLPLPRASLLAPRRRPSDAGGTTVTSQANQCLGSVSKSVNEEH